MFRRRHLIVIALLALALIIVLSAMAFRSTRHEIIVPIDPLPVETKKPKSPLPVQTSSPAERPELVHSQALHPSPDPRLVETTSFGLLPRKSETGDRPADIYARPFHPQHVPPTIPQVAILIMNAGIREMLTTEAYLTLPPDVSFSVSPYANDAERQVRDIRNRGHEAYLEVQSKADATMFEDRGPYTLDPNKDSDANQNSLMWMMSRFTGYVGLIGDMTDMAAQSPALTNLLSRETTARGLTFTKLVRSGMTARRIANSPDNYLIVLLPGQTPAALHAALVTFLNDIGQFHRLVLCVEPVPLALDTLKDWIVKHQSHEFDLVPLSALMR